MRLKRYTNRVFWKAIHLLSQPVSLGAMGLLLINDHLLREFWPSWWTGKIGDFAWLLFFPFLLAALFAWLIPPRLSHQERIVRWLAFGLTGSVFTLTKTLPGVHDVTTRCAETLLGFPIALQRDPTDLMALLSLGLGWRLWERQPASSPSYSLTGWLALPLAALLTMANMTMPDSGVDALTLKDQAVIARSSRSTFISTDGGLSWELSDVYHSTPIHTAIEISTDLKVKYRFTPGVAIEMSKDGGTTWHEEFSLSPTGQAARAYYERRAGNPQFEPGPLDAQVDPVTGNVIFAMGHEGVLVRKADAEWIWVPVGDYRRFEFGQVNAVLSLLVGEILLAVDFGLLSAVTLTLRLHTGRFRRILVAVGWVLWGLNAIILPPALVGTGTYGVGIAGFDHILLSAGALFVGFLVLKDMLILTQHSPETLPRLVVVGLSGILLFFLPYVFWAFDILPTYITAVLFAFGLGTVTLLVGQRTMRKFLEPVQEG